MLLVEVSTKDRDAVLGRFLASLVNSSFQDFDLLIINDGYEPIAQDEVTRFFLERLRKSHTVYVIEGTHISQAHNHNIPLYDRRFRSYDLILRADDDILLNKFAIERMFNTLRTTDAAAVSGLWFEDEWYSEELHDRAYMSWYYSDRPETCGKVAILNSNWQQRLYSNAYIYPEHLFSNCMYRADMLRRAGGWPEIYSRGVAHCEETDGTYRLYLSGGLLVVNPEVTGQHLRAAGGIRSDKDVSRKQADDVRIWSKRIEQIREINFSPSVAIWCAHSFGTGGAQRAYYYLVSELQKRMDVYPIDETSDGYKINMLSPEECQKRFGFTYTLRPLLHEYDVCIVFGYKPLKPVRAKRYILYTLFPDDGRYDFDGFDLVLGISDYTSRYILNRWNILAPVCYCVPPFEIAEDVGQKENIILIVSRLEPEKSILALMEIFSKHFSDKYELYIIGGTSGGLLGEYEDYVLEVASKTRNVTVLLDVEQEILEQFYRRARFLWAAKGYQNRQPDKQEHLGLTPFEAVRFGVIPLVYDSGGYAYTVNEAFRWRSEEELVSLMERYRDGADIGRVIAPSLIGYDWITTFEDYVRRVNSGTLKIETVDITVNPRKIRVAAIADSPFLTTGFGNVSRMLYDCLVKKDIFELCVLGIMDSKQIPPFDPKYGNLPFAFYPVYQDDLQAHKTLPLFLQWAKPDVIWELYDPGNLFHHYQTASALGIKAPWVAYFPVEGDPPPDVIEHIVDKIDFPVTYCRSSADLVERYTGKRIDYVYHGMDHGNFHPLDVEKRKAIRRAVGWDDKFVVINVGMNKRVKELYYLIEAIDLLLKDGIDDIYLYLHTKKFDSNIMQGWNLDWIIKTLDNSGKLARHILFPLMQDKFRGVPYVLESFVYGGVPQDPKMRGLVFNGLDYVTRMGLADLYVDVSSAEGWGLPPLEAVACGVPMITVADGLVRSEVHARYAIDMLKPVHYCRWHTGARLLLISPDDVARAIKSARSKIERGDYVDYSQEVVRDLKWSVAGDKFADLIVRAYNKI